MIGDEPLPNYDFAPLAEGVNCGGFRCSNGEINRWFSREALRDHTRGANHVTCATVEGAPNRPIGLYAISTVAEEVRNLPGSYHRFRGGDYFSAMQLVWLATDRQFEGRGLGTLMVGQVIRLFADIGPKIRLPHLIVIPAREDHDRLSRFYAGLGFTPYKDGEAMFLSVQDAVDAVRIQEGEIAAAAVPPPDPSAPQPEA